MNREARRRLDKLKKQGTPAKKLVTEDKVNDLITDKLAESHSTGIDQGITLNQILTIKVLHDTFGFGKKRIHRYVDGLIDEMQKVSKGQTDFPKLMDETLKKYELNRSDVK